MVLKKFYHTPFILSLKISNRKNKNLTKQGQPQRERPGIIFLPKQLVNLFCCDTIAFKYKNIPVPGVLNDPGRTAEGKMAEVVAVCTSKFKGTMKKEVPEITLRIDHGIEGDAHAGNWHRQVSLLGSESVDKMKKVYPDIPIGAFAENILTKGITLYKLPIGTILKVGCCVLKVTQIGKECHASCAIRKQVGDCVMPREGIFAIVLKEGTVRAGDAIEILDEEYTRSF